MVVGRLHSYREGNFSGAMLNFGRVPILYTEVTKWSLFRDEAFQEYFEYTPGVLRAYVKPKHLDALTFTLQPVIEAKRLATCMVKHQNPYNKVGKCWEFTDLECWVYTKNQPFLQLQHIRVLDIPNGRASLPDAHGLQVHLGRSEGVERRAEDGHLQVLPSIE